MSDSSLSFTQRGVRPVNKLICLTLASVALMMLDSRFAAVQTAKNYISTALYPLQWIANKPVEWYEYGSSMLQSQTYLLGETSGFCRKTPVCVCRQCRLKFKAGSLMNSRPCFL